MTVAFFSNFLLHHQTPFCEAMVREIGNGFTFVATEEIPQERLELGYRDLSHSAAYAINTYESAQAKQRALQIAIDSDVVIIGSAPEEYIQERLKRNKLIFRYSERFFKEGRWRIFDPRVLRARYRNDIQYRNKDLYMLCASAYTAPDCRFIFSYPDKTFKWGYFTSVKEFEPEELIRQKQNATVKILWAGRMIAWKHPEYPIKLLKRLRDEEISCKLDMIGDGELESECRQMIERCGLKSDVALLGTMPPEQVRLHMEKADIFVFTSDRKEGWGAVLNESMASGCAVVANRAIGSVPFLIKEGENGFAYSTFGELYQKVKQLILDVELREKMGQNAYLTMKNIWNADVASRRFIKLSDGVLRGNIPKYSDGPCSRA